MVSGTLAKSYALIFTANVFTGPLRRPARRPFTYRPLIIIKVVHDRFTTVIIIITSIASRHVCIARAVRPSGCLRN